MFDEYRVFFPHRRKSDGTFESICLSCLETVAHAATEADLHEHDRQHVCREVVPKIPTAPRGMTKYKTPTFELSEEDGPSKTQEKSPEAEPAGR